MANHAYVILPVTPDSEQIHKDVKEICLRKFPEFTLEFEKNDGYPDGVWLLTYKDIPDLRMIFWIGTCWSDTEEIPCIEFRHGHWGAGDWLWWIEYEIREELALRYNAMVVDDCDGILCQPETERFNTYCEYLQKTLGNHATGLLKAKMDFMIANNPKELLHLIGNL